MLTSRKPLYSLYFLRWVREKKKWNWGYNSIGHAEIVLLRDRGLSKKKKKIWNQISMDHGKTSGFSFLRHMQISFWFLNTFFFFIWWFLFNEKISRTTFPKVVLIQYGHRYLRRHHVAIRPFGPTDKVNCTRMVIEKAKPNGWNRKKGGNYWTNCISVWQFWISTNNKKPQCKIKLYSNWRFFERVINLFEKCASAQK